MTINPAHGFSKSRGIANLCTVVILARVEAESLFVYVAEKVERLYGNVGAVQLPLEQAPEVFDSIRVNSSVNVVLKMIDDLVYVISINGHISRVLIGVHDGASINRIEDSITQRGL